MLVTIRPVGWDVTSLPRVGASTPLARDARSVDHDFRLVLRPGYDGQFYWAIALDPLATGSAHRDVDKPSYRYGHPLLGWVGWALSGGQSGAAAAALLVAGLLSIAAAAAIAAWLGGPGASLFVACNPGLLYAASHSLAEPLAAALLLGALATWHDRPRTAALLCALLPLAKEQLVLVPLVLGVWVLVRGRRSNAPLYGLSLVPAVVWWVAMRIHLGGWFTSGGTALGAPFVGWKRAVLDAGVAAAGGGDEARILVLLGLGALLAVATVGALRLRRPVDAVYVLFAVLAACLATNATEILRDALRNTALLVVLVPLVLAQEARPRRTSAAVASSARSTGV